MPDLLYLARPHDLPPMWDGHTVEWRGWHEMPAVHLCGRGASAMQREVCTACGSVEPTVRNVGTYYVRNQSRGTTDGRRLTAIRCPDCRHDSVRDYDGVWWDLGPEDYDDEGSRAVR